MLTRVHTDKYEDFGGKLAAFDPVTNLRVGAQVLRECIQRAGGSIEGGLKLYVGAVTTDGSGYINKVIAEHLRIQSVALGKPMPRSFPVYRPIPVVAPASQRSVNGSRVRACAGARCRSPGQTPRTSGRRRPRSLLSVAGPRRLAPRQSATSAKLGRVRNWR